MTPRLAITLSEETHRALKEASVRLGKTIGKLVGESLDDYGIETAERAGELVARARQRADLNEADALDLAVAGTRKVREGGGSDAHH